MCNFFGDLEYKDQAAVNKCNNFLFSLFLVISEIKKVSTCLESGISFDNFDLAFDGGGTAVIDEIMDRLMARADKAGVNV